MTDDERLIALIDNELDGEARAELTSRLVADAGLRSRYEALRRSRADIASAFETLLDQAPVARLSAAIPPPVAARLAPRPRFGWLELAAGLVVGAIVAGAAVWTAAGRGERVTAEDWRTAVIEYAELYSQETFAFPNPEAGIATKQLQAVGGKVGLDLTPESIAIPGLAYKIAINFVFAGKPLGEIAYTDDKGDPVLFCILASGNGAPSPRVEKRDGFSTASWSRDGRSYMVAARQPENRVAELAQTLAARF
jgi:anti-sigma factor RsiW